MGKSKKKRKLAALRAPLPPQQPKKKSKGKKAKPKKIKQLKRKILDDANATNGGRSDKGIENMVDGAVPQARKETESDVEISARDFVVTDANDEEVSSDGVFNSDDEEEGNDEVCG